MSALSPGWSVHWVGNRGIPRKAHEHLAACLYEAWRNGELVAGAEFTVKGLAQSHSVTEYAAHQTITHLKECGVLEVRNGHRSVVLPCPESVRSYDADERSEPTPSQDSAVASAPSPADVADTPFASLVRLGLIHLGRIISNFTSRADPSNFDTLEILLRSAVRRAGSDHARIADYELAVRVPGQVEPVTRAVLPS